MVLYVLKLLKYSPHIIQSWHGSHCLKQYIRGQWAHHTFISIAIDELMHQLCREKNTYNAERLQFVLLERTSVVTGIPCELDLGSERYEIL